MELLKLRDWYLENFPEDDFAKDRMDSGKTFQDLFDTLDNYGNVYACIGVADSLIRERLFTKLSQIMGVDYEVVYDQWQMAS